MAYASLTSLENTINRILNHTVISISHEEKQQIICLREYAISFITFLEKFPDKFNSLEARMREVTNKTEDILEYLVQKKHKRVYVSSSNDESGCVPSEGESICNPSENDRRKHELELMFAKVIEDIYLVAGEVKVLEKVTEKIDLLAREVEEINHSSRSKDANSSALTSTSTAHETVGFEDYAKDIKDRLCGQQFKLQVISICGMGGIGKTTLARKVYEDPLIVEHFVIRCWVTVSQEYSVQRIVSSLRKSLKEYKTGISGSTDKDEVYRILMPRKYVIVMDDIWSPHVWDEVKRMFPDVGNGSRIVLTTRLSHMAYYPDPLMKVCEMQLMDTDQSWKLLKHKLFEGKCYPELENIGKEIANSCKGLPLVIVLIAGLLSEVPKNPYSWHEIAKKVKSVKTTEQEQIEEIISLSYTNLPQYLRPCFLYMSSFRDDQEINVSRLVRLWVAEGFVKRPNTSQSLEDEAEECLNDLIKRNLVLVMKRKRDGRVKRCSLHDLVRDLIIRKAHKSKFLLSFMDKNVKKEHFLEKVKNARRLSVDTSNLPHLLSFDGLNIHTIMCSRNHLSNLDDTKLDFVRSVRLLRVLDAERVGVNSLHPQLFDLFNLRYLAIRYNYGVSLSWSNIQNLQTLIIHSNHEANFRLYWCMPQLRHVYFNGLLYFVDPVASDSPLENLQTLSYVSHSNCKERILKMIPNLKKLKIHCPVGARHGNAAYLNYLIHLNKLESLAINAGGRVESRPKYYNFSLPMKLKKLCLIYIKLSWDNMAIVGSLPDLRVLKLIECKCIDGSTWETSEGKFLQLEFLLIKGLNFKDWITERSHFPSLQCLLLDDCEHLNEVPIDIGEIPTLELIEIKGRVKISLVKSAEEIRAKQEDMENNTLQVVCFGAKLASYDSDELEFASDGDEDEVKGEDDTYGYSDDEVIDGASCS